MKRKLHSVSYIDINGYPNSLRIGERGVIAINDMSVNGILRYEVCFENGDMTWLYNVKQVLFKKIEDDNNK